jgi:hypothetical protein
MLTSLNRVESAINRSASEYLHDRVWEPIGAEADAKWLLDAEGFELAHFGFNAVLRDYAPWPLARS